MVTFTCQNCGDSVKKPRVDKHINYECKKKNYGHAKLCCIDCLNDFDAESYTKHTSCVSEAERYSAPGFVAKPSANKGEKKQNSWIDVLNSVSNRSDLTGSQRQLLNAINQYQNVPRKKSKFQNFIKSSVRHIRVSPQTVDQLYDMLEQAFKTTSGQNTNTVKKVAEANGQSDTNSAGENSNAEPSMLQNEKKKRKLESSLDAQPPNDGVNESIDVANETSKKKKKRKHIDGLENQKNDADRVEPHSAVISIDDKFSNVLTECDEQTRKKKKKRMHCDGVENLNDDAITLPVDVVDDNSLNLNNDCGEKTRKKKKKRKDNDTSEASNAGDALLDSCSVENLDGVEKKKKLNKNLVTDSLKANKNSSEIPEQTVEPTEEPVRTKRKKHKTENTTATTEEQVLTQSDVGNMKIEKKKKKKNKKKQESDLGASETNKLVDEMAVDNAIVDENEEKANLETEVSSEQTKKSKWKKRAHEKASTEVASKSETVGTDEFRENETSKKKKKKKLKNDCQL